jgi:hypothetical protein
MDGSSQNAMLIQMDNSNNNNNTIRPISPAMPPKVSVNLQSLGIQPILENRNTTNEAINDGVETAVDNILQNVRRNVESGNVQPQNRKLLINRSEVENRANAIQNQLLACRMVHFCIFIQVFI